MREIKDNEEYPGVDTWDFIFNWVQTERAATIARLIRQIEYEKYFEHDIVERLKKHLLVHECTESFCSNPMGGGRESGEQGVLRAPETVSSHKVPARADAAANPAALCTCAVIIGRGPCPQHGWPATKPSVPMIYDEGGIVIHKKRVNDSICNICGMSELQVKAHWDDKQPGFHFFKPKEVL